MDRRLRRPQSPSGHYGEQKDLAPAGNRTMAVQPIAIVTELYDSSYFSSGDAWFNLGLDITYHG
jgi:hypothetical protein